MLGNLVIARPSRASRVRGRGFDGERSHANGRKVVGKTLLPIRKTSCAYTQNTLRLYAKSPRLNAKTIVFFRVYLLLVMVGFSFNNGTGAIDLFCEDESDHLV